MIFPRVMFEVKEIFAIEVPIEIEMSNNQSTNKQFLILIHYIKPSIMIFCFKFDC